MGSLTKKSCVASPLILTSRRNICDVYTLNWVELLRDDYYNSDQNLLWSSFCFSSTFFVSESINTHWISNAIAMARAESKAVHDNLNVDYVINYRFLDTSMEETFQLVLADVEQANPRPRKILKDLSKH